MSGKASSTLIAAHDMADFDALAALVAAGLLYPDATLGVGRHLARPVREFASLHKDWLRTLRCEHADLEGVQTLVLVDVRARSRVKHVERVLAQRDRGARLRVEVWDHHPDGPDDVRGDVEHVEAVGAVTTLLVEKLMADGVEIDPIAATLMALGIHDDTGSLLLAHTTARDVAALRHLLSEGARLDVVNRFLRPAFDASQRALLSLILADTQVVRVGGLEVGLACVEAEGAVTGIAEVVAEASRLEGHPALFALVQVAPDKALVVGRASARTVDVGASLRALGGGGHRGAGSAVARGPVASTRERLVAALQATSADARRVREHMTRDVFVVAPELSLNDLIARLWERAFVGAPVLGAEGELLGVVSRRDAARAIEAGRGELPVASHMSSPATTVAPDATVEDALALMSAGDVGRLPVLEDGKLVGIITRADVLRVLYAGSIAPLSN